MPAFLGTLSGGGIVALIAIISGAVVLCVLILTVGWAKMHRTRVQAALKRDMLARNLSVEEIERLTQSDNVRICALQQEERKKVMQMQADFHRDLLAKGLPIDEVMRIAAASIPRNPFVSGPSMVNQANLEDKAHSMAAVIVQMVKGAMASLDVDAVAELIKLYLRHNEFQPPATESKLRGDAVALASAIAQMVQGPGGSLDEHAVAGLIEMFLRPSDAQAMPVPLPTVAPPREDRAPIVSSVNVRRSPLEG
jgi:hypothetical protein